MPEAQPLATSLPAPELVQSHVLVVDDDPACLEEYAETISTLGYTCRTAADGREALRLISEDPRIGIVLIDLYMPSIDGITLLEELSSRFMNFRPIAPIVLTGAPTLDFAVRAMRSNAMDFLEKPVSPSLLSAALRRASTRWAQMVGQFRLLALAQATAPALAAGASGGAPASQHPAAQSELLRMVRNIVKLRRTRNDFLDRDLFADPSWDILLDLTSAALEGKPVPVSSVCAATQVPASTALRHVRHLVETGLVKRWQDPSDKRRTLLELEEPTLEAMLRYLESIRARQLVSSS